MLLLEWNKSFTVAAHVVVSMFYIVVILHYLFGRFACHAHLISVCIRRYCVCDEEYPFVWRVNAQNWKN